MLKAATLEQQIVLSSCIIYLKHEEFDDIILFHVFWRASKIIISRDSPNL
jgi:hypothetical protein